jgi:hypothetical protein
VTGSTGSASINFEIVEPSGNRRVQALGPRASHKKGLISCGFYADVYVTPADVSFHNIRRRELAAVATAWSALRSLHGENHDRRADVCPQPATFVREGFGTAMTTRDMVFVWELLTMG